MQAELACPRQPWLTDWPMSDLELLFSCPLCSSTDRVLLHSGIGDYTFFTAPGKWNLWGCNACSSAYIDPRPTSQAIFRAYAEYYTHSAPQRRTAYEELPWIRRLRRQVANGYTNGRFGSQEVPALHLSPFFSMLFRMLGSATDRQFRHLPPPKTGGTLLDVGCGEGTFLLQAQSCGWTVAGVEPDAVAASHAARAGINVLAARVEELNDIPESFDAITLNHVIEHVHDPRSVLSKCHRLLKPGGVIWVETPNIGSYGYRKYKQFWRGLEVPRHLVLFNAQSLRQALERAGFDGVRSVSRPSACRGMAAVSAVTREQVTGHTPWWPERVATFVECTYAELIGIFVPARREFLTVLARKPS